MALIHVDDYEDGLHASRNGFYAAGISVGPAAGRGFDGSYGLRVGDNHSAHAGYYFPMSGDTAIFGFWHRIDDTTGTNVLKGSSVLSGTGTQRTWTINGEAIVSGAADFPPGYNWCELKVVYHASLGTMEMRVGGVTVASDTGLNTGTAPTIFNAVFGGGAGSDVDSMSLDHMYFCDGTGSYNNDFLGEYEIQYLYPDGNGNSSVMVGSDGNSVDNYLLVDEPGRSPSSADYVGSATEGDKDTYTLEDTASGTYDVIAVATSLYAANATAGTKFMRPVVRTAATDYPGTSQPLSSVYQGYDHYFEENPNTLAEWTTSEVDGIEVGQETRDS